MLKRLAGLGLYAASAALMLSRNPAPAFAQDEASSGGIEEVVVTATRRSEELSKVPESVSAFTTERMDQLDAKSFADLVRFTPGVTFDPSSNDISIRGIDSSAGAATTGIYIDDTPIQIRTLGFNSNNTLPSVFDLQRVEVLRGPQGTLFGAGSEGGTVRYITPQPSLTDYSVYAKTEVSTTENGDPSYEGGVAVGGPIAQDKLGFRVSGWYRRDGGYIDHVDYTTGAMLSQNANWTDTYVVRGALAWQPMDGLLIAPSVYHQNIHANNDEEYWVALSDPGSGVYRNATPELMQNKDQFTLPALKIDWNLPGAEIISNTSYFTRHEVVQGYSGTLYNLSYFQSLADHGQDPNGNKCPGGLCRDYWLAYGKNGLDAPPLLTAGGIDLPGFGPYKSLNYITNDQKNWTEEARVQTTDPDASLQYILGVFYSSDEQLSVEEINDPQLPALTQYLWGETMGQSWGYRLLPNGDDYINHTLGHDSQTAVFANATYAITDNLKAQAGARYADTHFDFTNFSNGPQNFGPWYGNTGQKDEHPFTPMGGVTYQVTTDDMVYATVAKGYRIGGANPPFPAAACAPDLEKLGASGVPETYNSDTVVSYEAGSKDRFLDRRLQVSTSVYYLKWNNIQQSNYLPSCGFQYTANLGTAESKGFDMQGEWLITDALDVDFSLGYTDAQYTTTSRVGTSAAAILANKGDKLPGSPWTFSLGAQYSREVMGQAAFVRLDYEFESQETGRTLQRDPVTTSYDSGLVAEPETNVVTLRAGTTLGNVDVSVFADNLLGSHPQLDLSHQDPDTLLYEASTLRPRTIGITAIYRY